MSLILTLTGLTESERKDIVNTSYEVSRKADMSDIILFSYNDTVNKTVIVFDFQPEDGKTYYARTKVTLKTGPQEWGPIDSITFDEDKEKALLKTPSPINTPHLSTTFWQHEHPYSGFNVIGTPYEVTGDSKHTKSIWRITDVLTGETLHSLDSEIQLENLFVDVLLPVNKQLRISVIYVGDNDDYSPEGSLVITTGLSINDKKYQLLNADIDNTIFRDIGNLPNSTYEWAVFDSETEESILSTNNSSSSVSSLYLGKNTLSQGKTYIVQCEEVNELKDPKFDYYILKTLVDDLYGLPQPFPYKLGQGQGSSIKYKETVEKE